MRNDHGFFNFSSHGYFEISFTFPPEGVEIGYLGSGYIPGQVSKAGRNVPLVLTWSSRSSGIHA